VLTLTSSVAGISHLQPLQQGIGISRRDASKLNESKQALWK
jgi:hypothetical protein